MNTVLSSALVALIAGAASAGTSTLIADFDLLDHPDGAENPPPYGLRVDNIIGSGVATLSFDEFFDSRLRVFDNSGDLSIVISGTLFGGQVSGGAYLGGGETYEVTMTYSASVLADGDGWRVNGFDAANSGSITRVSDNMSWDIYTTTDMDNNAFVFQNDGHRLDGDSTSWVGRGWITDQANGSDPFGGNRDWLFRAIEREVPAPGASLLTIAGVAVMGRRRR